MNTPVVFASLQDDDIAGARALYGLAAAQTSSQAALEAPNEGQTLTGIGLLRGWACDAETVSVRIDGHRRIPILVGSPRGDTEEICGTADTGFALLLNWNNLGAGDHTLDLFINSRLYATRTVTVITYGQGFFRGLEKEWTIGDWPEPGTDTIIAWNEATQNIEIVGIERTEIPTTVSVSQLLGTWTLTNTAGLTHRIHINRLSEDGHAASGQTDTWDVLVVFKSSGAYTFHMRWPGTNECHKYSFDLIAPSRIEGEYLWTSGGCNSNTQPRRYSFTGTRQ